MTIPNREVTMLVGDWNAKVGDTLSDDHLRNFVGCMVWVCGVTAVKSYSICALIRNLAL